MRLLDAAALGADERRHGEHQCGRRIARQPIPGNLGTGARHQPGCALRVVLLERDQSELRQAQGVDSRGGDGGPPRARLEPLPRYVRVSAEVVDDAAQQVAQRLAGTLRRQQRGRVLGVLGHEFQTVAPERGAERGDSAGDLRLGGGCRGSEPVLGAIAVAVGELRAGGRQGQARVACDLGIGEPAQPMLDGRARALLDRARHAAPDQVPGALDLVRGERMVEPALGVSGADVPGAGAPVQPRLESAIGAVEVGAKQLGEKAMVPEALARAVECHQREAGAPQAGEHVGRPCVPHERVAQRRGQHIQDGGVFGEPPLRPRPGRPGPRRAGTPRRADRRLRSAPRSGPRRAGRRARVRPATMPPASLRWCAPVRRPHHGRVGDQPRAAATRPRRASSPDRAHAIPSQRLRRAAAPAAPAAPPARRARPRSRRATGRRRRRSRRATPDGGGRERRRGPARCDRRERRRTRCRRPTSRPAAASPDRRGSSAASPRRTVADPWRPTRRAAASCRTRRGRRGRPAGSHRDRPAPRRAVNDVRRPAQPVAGWGRCRGLAPARGGGPPS